MAPTGIYSASDNLHWFGTTRVRIGFLPTERLLVYVTGGAIYGHDAVTAQTFFLANTEDYPASGGTTRAGGTVGAGIEYALNGNLSVKFEGLYYDMGTVNATFTCPVGAGYCTPGFTEGGTFAIRGGIIRGGLNWHFGGGPVYAK